MNKVMRVGTIKTWEGGRRASVYVAASVKNGRLSITGVVGPLSSGNALGGCGQIDMEFAHRDTADNDKRYTSPITPDQFNFAPGWDAEKWLDLLDIWSKWHLNNMHAECEHQRALGWTWADHPSAECPTCGYKLGHSWMKVELPAEVVAQIEAMPDADRRCPWGSMYRD